MQTHPSQLFQNWLSNVARDFDVHEVEILHVEQKRGAVEGDEPLFITLRVRFTDVNKMTYSRLCFLRTDTVGILVVLSVEGKRFVLLIEQPLVAVGEAAHLSIPAGICEGGEVDENALRELREETGVNIAPEKLVNMTKKLYGTSWRGIYPSAGACSETMHLFCCECAISAHELTELEGRICGVATEHERIRVHVVPFEDVVRLSPDPKVHSAVLMFQTLFPLEAS